MSRASATALVLSAVAIVLSLVSLWLSLMCIDIEQPVPKHSELAGYHCFHGHYGGIAVLKCREDYE